MNQIWDHILYNQKSAKRCDENFLLRIRPRFPPNLSTRYKSPGLLRDRQVICIPKHSWITVIVPGLAAFALLHRFVYWWKMRVNQRLSGLATDKRRGWTHSYDNETTRNWHNIDKGQILMWITNLICRFSRYLPVTDFEWLPEEQAEKRMLSSSQKIRQTLAPWSVGSVARSRPATLSIFSAAS